MSSSGKRVGPKSKVSKSKIGKGIVSEAMDGVTIKKLPGILDEVYIVERIVKKKIEAGVIKYLIKWEDWPSSSNTWEPIDHIPAVMVKDFEEYLYQSLRDGTANKLLATNSRVNGSLKRDKAKDDDSSEECAKDDEYIETTVKQYDEPAVITIISPAALQDKIVDRIETVTHKARKNDPTGKSVLVFIVKFEESEELYAVLSEDAYQAFPSKVIEYYESIINFS